MFSLTALLLGAAVAFNYLVDPYGAWGNRLVNPIFRHINQERVATPYSVWTARPAILLVGSSRVLMGIPVNQGERDGVMNGALSAARIPELCRLVLTALHNPKLQRVVWGVDFFAFDQHRADAAALFDARIERHPDMILEDTLVSGTAVHDSYSMLTRAWRGRRRLRPTETAEVPWPMPLVCEDFRRTSQRGLISATPAEIEEQLYRDVPNYNRYQYSPTLFKMFRDTIAQARRQGVKVTLFVPPMSEYELELIRQSGHWIVFGQWKRALAMIGPFWDFSGYNAAAPDDRLFMHVMHFKAAPGYLMLRIMLGKPVVPCNPDARDIIASVREVNSANIDSHLAEQDTMLQSAMETDHDSRYVKIAARALSRIQRNDRSEIAHEPSRAPLLGSLRAPTKQTRRAASARARVRGSGWP